MLFYHLNRFDLPVFVSEQTMLPNMEWCFHDEDNYSYWESTFSLPFLSSGQLLLPSFSMNLPSYGYQFLLETSADSAILYSVGEKFFIGKEAKSSESISSLIDCFRIRQNLSNGSLKLRVYLDQATPIDQIAYVYAVSYRQEVSDLKINHYDELLLKSSNHYPIRVPKISQFNHYFKIDKKRICHPVSLLMLLLFLQDHPVDFFQFTQSIKDDNSQMYGIWSYGSYQMSLFGALGMLFFIENVSDIFTYLDHDIPVLISITTEQQSELPNSFQAHPDGHLLILTGYQGAYFFVNDPAAPTDDQVAQQYPIDALLQAWFVSRGFAAIFYQLDRV